MALRSGYKGFKKLLPGLKLFRPGTLGIDNDVLIPELNKTFFPRSEQAVLGAKNLIPYPYNNTTKTEGGVTFTLNADGTVGIDTDGSASSSNAYFSIVGQTEEKLKTGSYILSGGVNNNVVIQYYDVTAGKSYNSTNKDIIVPVVKGHTRQISIVVLSGTTVNNQVVKPMISFDGGEYVPPAMTNRELTELLLDAYGASDDVIQIGQLVVFNTKVKLTQAIVVGWNTTHPDFAFLPTPSKDVPCRIKVSGGNWGDMLIGGGGSVLSTEAISIDAEILIAGAYISVS